jgi:hypothetical protein
MIPSIALAEEDAKEHGILRYRHRAAPQRLIATAKP